MQAACRYVLCHEWEIKVFQQFLINSHLYFINLFVRALKDFTWIKILMLRFHPVHSKLVAFLEHEKKHLSHWLCGWKFSTLFPKSNFLSLSLSKHLRSIDRIKSNLSNGNIFFCFAFDRNNLFAMWIFLMQERICGALMLMK